MRYSFKLLATLFAMGVLARPQVPPANFSAFDVAAIKPGDSGGSVINRAANGRITAKNETLRALVTEAYWPLRQYQLTGGPPWAGSDRFTISAEPDSNQPRSREQVAAMLQTLLADRFHLKVHRETRDLDVYVLTVAKGGPKLKQSAPDAKRASSGGGGAGGSGAGGGGGGAVDTIQLVETRASMEELAFAVSRSERNSYVGGRPVLDQTGLTGTYDVTLEFATEKMRDAGAKGASLFTALQEQLGLKLERQKAPIEVLVIDSAERPELD